MLFRGEEQKKVCLRMGGTYERERERERDCDDRRLIHQLGM